MLPPGEIESQYKYYTDSGSRAAFCDYNCASSTIIENYWDICLEIAEKAGVRQAAH
jgi:hypothetical protein